MRPDVKEISIDDIDNRWDGKLLNGKGESYISTLSFDTFDKAFEYFTRSYPSAEIYTENFSKLVIKDIDGLFKLPEVLKLSIDDYGDHYIVRMFIVGDNLPHTVRSKTGAVLSFFSYDQAEKWCDIKYPHAKIYRTNFTTELNKKTKPETLVSFIGITNVVDSNITKYRDKVGKYAVLLRNDRDLVVTVLRADTGPLVFDSFNQAYYWISENFPGIPIYEKNFIKIATLREDKVLSPTFDKFYSTYSDNKKALEVLQDLLEKSTSSLLRSEIKEKIDTLLWKVVTALELPTRRELQEKING
jgi:hypothetical protein